MERQRSVSIYLASAFLVALTINMTYMAGTFHAIDLGASDVQIGLIGTCINGFYCLLCPLFGWLLRKTDPKRKVLAAVLCYIVLIPPIPFCGSFWPVALLIMLLGVPGGLYWPTIEHVICDGRSRTGMRRNLGLFCLLWCAGMTAGTLLSGPLFEWKRVAPFLVPTAVAWALVFTFMFVPSPRAGASATGESDERDEEEHVPAALARRFLGMARSVNFLVYLALGSTRYLFAKYARVDLELSATTTSALLFLVSLAQTAVFFALRQTGFWHYRYWPVAVCLAGSVGAYAGLTVTRAHWLMGVCFVFMGLTAGLAYFGSIYYAMARPNTGAQHAAWHESTLGLGAALGPITGGWLAHATGDSTSPFLLSAGACALGLAIVVWLWLSATMARRRTA